jgi:hypothetical protein
MKVGAKLLAHGPLVIGWIFSHEIFTIKKIEIKKKKVGIEFINPWAQKKMFGRICFTFFFIFYDPWWSYLLAKMEKN